MSGTVMEDEISIESLKLAAERVMKKVDRNKLIRIPPKLYKFNPEAFVPQLVSIGPFHHLGHNFNRFKDVNILAMEGKKRMFMLQALENGFLNKFQILEALKNFLKEKSKDIQDCYSEETDMSDDMLLKIMLVDACFILRLIDFSLPVTDDAVGRYPRDLALLENQIPFFVLQGLVAICQPQNPLKRMTNSLLYLFQLTPESPPLSDHAQDPSHLLDLIRKCHQPEPLPQLPNTAYTTHIQIHQISMKGVHLMNATKLVQAGVTFKSVRPGKLLVIEFNKGVLKLTPLIIHDFTDTILTNLLALDHLSPYDKPYFTSYVAFMSHLIQTEDDLQLLANKGIIINKLGSKQDATKMFSNITKQFVLTEFCYSDVCNQIEEYTKTRWRRYLLDLKTRCFNSPWTTVSVLAASLLLILSALQTIYSMLSYYQLP